ncbi:general stress protein [Nitratifractor sp.]|uniref:general stress protein n=1 Tax=Nitratifractor sp. TaxID=2268144 RepID=UPI0025F3411B|nr:general stress protein [Nitratifractor sp.]
MKKHFAVAVYTDAQKAKKAVEKLLEAGLEKRAISLVARSNEDDVEKVEVEKVDSDVALWGSQGALWGGVLGALLGGAFFFIPGFGPIVGAGPVSAALAGMLGGAMTGGAALGLADALIEWGMGEIEAKHYEELVEKGEILVIVHGDKETVDNARTLLEETEAEKVEMH